MATEPRGTNNAALPRTDRTPRGSTVRSSDRRNRRNTPSPSRLSSTRGAQPHQRPLPPSRPRHRLRARAFHWCRRSVVVRSPATPIFHLAHRPSRNARLGGSGSPYERLGIRCRLDRDEGRVRRRIRTGAASRSVGTHWDYSLSQFLLVRPSSSAHRRRSACPANGCAAGTVANQPDASRCGHLTNAALDGLSTEACFARIL